MRALRCMAGLHDDAQKPGLVPVDAGVIHLVCSRCGRDKKVRLPSAMKGNRPPEVWSGMNAP